jgi:hypothetical protein
VAKQDLQQFLVALSTDPELRQRYKEDPDGVLAEAGLTAEESALVKSGDTDAMRSYLGDEAAGAMITVDE